MIGNRYHEGELQDASFDNWADKLNNAQVMKDFITSGYKGHDPSLFIGTANLLRFVRNLVSFPFH